MQNRLILVSNGRNFDMFTALQRSSPSSHLVPVHDWFRFTEIPVHTTLVNWKAVRFAATLMIVQQKKLAENWCKLHR